MSSEFQNIKKQIEEITDMLKSHMEHEDAEIRTTNMEIRDIKETLYGNKDKGIVGMVTKIDESHEVLTKAKGIPQIIQLMLLIGAAAALFKGWFGGHN